MASKSRSTEANCGSTKVRKNISTAARGEQHKGRIAQGVGKLAPQRLGPQRARSPSTSRMWVERARKSRRRAPAPHTSAETAPDAARALRRSFRRQGRRRGSARRSARKRPMSASEARRSSASLMRAPALSRSARSPREHRDVLAARAALNSARSRGAKSRRRLRRQRSRSERGRETRCGCATSDARRRRRSIR